MIGKNFATFASRYNRIMKHFFRRYNLFFVNLISASGLLATSDVFVQAYYEKKKNLDKQRVHAALITGAVMGVEGHVWYSFIDRVMMQQTWRHVFKKVAVDQTVGAPICALTYIVGTSILESRTSSAELKSDIRTNFIPLLLADLLIFAPIQLFNFKYIPPFYRVPFLSLAAFIFDAFISAYKHEDHSRPIHDRQH